MIISILSGALAGWLAGKLMNSQLNFWGNMVLGILGGFVGNVVLRLVGIYSKGSIGGIVVSVIGACIVIALVRNIKK